jgi:hypothetical protein
MKVTPYLMDAAPALTAATVTTIPDVNPYIQAVILIISGVTALIRLFQATRRPEKNQE